MKPSSSSSKNKNREGMAVFKVNPLSDKKFQSRSCIFGPQPTKQVQEHKQYQSRIIKDLFANSTKKIWIPFDTKLKDQPKLEAFKKGFFRRATSLINIPINEPQIISHTGCPTVSDSDTEDIQISDQQLQKSLPVAKRVLKMLAERFQYGKIDAEWYVSTKSMKQRSSLLYLKRIFRKFKQAFNNVVTLQTKLAKSRKKQLQKIEREYTQVKHEYYEADKILEQAQVMKAQKEERCLEAQRNGFHSQTELLQDLNLDTQIYYKCRFKFLRLKIRQESVWDNVESAREKVPNIEWQKKQLENMNEREKEIKRLEQEIELYEKWKLQQPFDPKKQLQDVEQQVKQAEKAFSSAQNMLHTVYRLCKLFPERIEDAKQHFDYAEQELNAWRAKLRDLSK